MTKWRLVTQRPVLPLPLPNRYISTFPVLDAAEDGTQHKHQNVVQGVQRVARLATWIGKIRKVRTGI